MGLLDIVTGPLRSVLGVARRAETEVVRRSPLYETREVEERLDDAVKAIHRAADSMEKHVSVVDDLASSLPPLTESVTRLTSQLTELLQITVPLAAAERDISRVERFFRRRPPGEVGAPVEPPAK
jgi:hypothetical protein